MARGKNTNRFYPGDADSRKQIEEMLDQELEKPDPDIGLVSDLLDILVPEEPDADARQRIWETLRELLQALLEPS
jgi:hypothetical protein